MGNAGPAGSATSAGTTTPAPLLIRPAAPGDAEAISALILGMADRLTLHPDGRGAEQFLTTLSPTAILGYVRADNFRYWVGTVGGALAGLVALRGNTHLYHLFVAPAWQRRGLAGQLWAHARDDALTRGPVEAFTVNSSLHAAPVYRAFGFRDTGPTVEMHGIAFIPMQLPNHRTMR